MRRLTLLISALFILLPLTAQAYDVLVLRSGHDSISEGILKGFTSGFSGQKRVLVVSDYAEIDVVRIVREEHPKIILTIGDRAFAVAKPVRDIPILALVTLKLDPSKKGQRNVFTISPLTPPESYLSAFKSLGKRRIGLVYSRKKLGWYVDLAQKAALQNNVEIVLREVSSSQEVIPQLATLNGAVDALWMLPDSTAVTRETFIAYPQFASSNSVPLIAFSKSYLKSNAFAAIESDWESLGQQAAEYTKLIFSKKIYEQDEILFTKAYSVLKNNKTSH